MFHPSEIKAMKAAKNNRIKFYFNTETNEVKFPSKAKAKVVLLSNSYGVAYPCGKIDRCNNLATAQYYVRAFNR
jgi:hypothetical protein